MTDISMELNLCSNMFGALSEDIRSRLQAYVDNPTVKGWVDVNGLILADRPLLTFWQAVLKIKPSFPRTGRKTDQFGNVLVEWAEIPDRETAVKAIMYAAYIHGTESA